MKYWITHPNLTPGHDQQIEAAALATWARSGWQMRDDQTDPDDSASEPADPRPVVEPEPEPVEDVEPAPPVDEPVDDTHEAPASDPEPSTTTKKKGEV